MNADPDPSTIIANRFRLERRLGQGGMGSVWVAVQEPLGRRVAVKLIHSQLLDAAARERFHREATIVARLRCPHVVTLFDFGEHENAPYIAMELLEGETLRQRLGRGRLSVDEALSLARDVACGLRAAHEMGIVHRDLKPENVVVVPDPDRGGVAKLLDFGVARLAVRDDADAAEHPTAVGVVVGTPGYIAPEMVLAGRLDDPRSDLYALGVIMYEALCGVAPFSAPTALALVMKHATEQAPDPRAQCPDIPAPVAALVLRLLAKDPALRPEDSQTLIKEIDGLRAAMLASAIGTVTDASGSMGLAIGNLAGVTGPGLPKGPSIAVQPFAAVGTEDDALLAEGISEDILIALGCFRQLFVVAQTTMWQRGSRDTDALRVGRTLGVQYVLQGSVRHTGERVRINAALIDTLTGARVWAQRYDRPMDDVFAVQDEVTQAIVACVVGRVEQAHIEIARKKAPHTLQAYDWLARGRAYHHLRTPEDNARSRAALDQAVTLDPDYAQAHAWRACAIAQAWSMDGDAPRWIPEVKSSIARALALDDADAECHRLACEMAMYEGHLEKAELHHERAIALNPNDARIVGQRGELYFYLGRFADAADALERALRLDPLGPKSFLRHLARVHYMTGNLESAWRVLKGLDEARQDSTALMAAVAALRGDSEAARLLCAALKAPFKVSVPPFTTAALRERWLAGFHAAGLG